MVADGSVFSTLPSPESRGVKWEFWHCGLIKRGKYIKKEECRESNKSLRDAMGNFFSFSLSNFHLSWPLGW